MDAIDIQRLISRGEGLKIEFKRSGKGVPESLYETVASFSNTDGGTILLGVDDTGDITGIAEDSKLKKDLVSALNSKDCLHPPVYAQPFTVLMDRKPIVVLQIQSSSEIHAYKGAIYIREFESDINITNNQQQIGDLYLRKRNFFTETQIYPHLTMDDLDPGLFEKARKLIRNYRSDHPWLLATDEQILKDSALWRKDFKTGETGLTLAAALVFGKDTTIQSLLPAYKVEALVRIKNKDRWDDRITPPLRTNLIDTYWALKEFINKHLPEKFFLEGDQRIDLRDKIFREVIGNAIVHREYTNALSTEVVITATEVVITNPNKAVFHGPIDPKGFNPFPKNPNIRKFFTAFGWTDEIGSGVRNTNKYLPLYSDGAEPVFWEDETFKTLLPLRNISLGLFAKELQEWFELSEKYLPHLKKGLSTISVSPELYEADWDSLITELVPSWRRNGTQLAPLRWPDNQVIMNKGTETVPSRRPNSTELLGKRVRYLMSILALCSNPIKNSELMEAIDYKNQKAFRDNYLLPLRQVGYIVLTNPGNPTDPENKYTLTEAGKIFLGGML